MWVWVVVVSSVSTFSTLDRVDFSQKVPLCLAIPDVIETVMSCIYASSTPSATFALEPQGLDIGPDPVSELMLEVDLS